MSDLRPIETASYAAIKAPTSLGRPPKLEWIAIRDLVIDPVYQREITDVGRTNVRKIATAFNWSMFAPVVVAPAGSGKYAIVDGQHRTTAAALCGVDKVPCAIIEGARAAQAAAFKAINGNVTKLSSMQLYHAAVAAGDIKASTIAKVCAAAGVTILRYPKAWNIIGAGETMAPTVIARAVARVGAAVATLALQCIVATGVLGGLRGPIIIATCDLLNERGAWCKDPERLLQAFRGLPIDKMLFASASEAASARGTSTAEAFLARLTKALAERLGEAPAPAKPKVKIAPNRPAVPAPAPAPRAANGGGAPTRAPAPATSKPRAPSRPVEPSISANGVTVSFDPEDESVSYRGKSTEVTYRQAKVAAILARAMPHPVGRAFIVGKLFNNGTPPSTADMVVDSIAVELGKVVASIGLKVNVVRGVGFSLGEVGR